MSEHARTDADGAWLAPLFYRTEKTSVLVHTAVVEGRRVVDRLVITAPDISAATLRELRMGQIAAYAERGSPADGRAYTRLTAALTDIIPPDYDFDREPVMYTPPPHREPLTRPDGTDPAAFSRRVADAYNEMVLYTSTPAKWIAAEAGVPVTTVHRWVRDARRLGLLPPARKGRAG